MIYRIDYLSHTEKIESNSLQSVVETAKMYATHYNCDADVSNYKDGVLDREICTITKNGEATFHVEITETLSREINVKASSLSEAIDKVQEMYDNEEIVLTSDDYITTEII